MVPNNSTSAVALIAAMITPALLILGSASLVAAALLRMARVVDRTRVMTSMALDGHLERMGINESQFNEWLVRHRQRARYAEGSIALLFCAIVLFIATCLSIAVTQLLAGSLQWVPVVLAVCGTLLMLAGALLMVAECRASARQIREEIAVAIALLEKPKS